MLPKRREIVSHPTSSLCYIPERLCSKIIKKSKQKVFTDRGTKWENEIIWLHLLRISSTFSQFSSFKESKYRAREVSPFFSPSPSGHLHTWKSLQAYSATINVSAHSWIYDGKPMHNFYLFSTLISTQISFWWICLELN